MTEPAERGGRSQGTQCRGDRAQRADEVSPLEFEPRDHLDNIADAYAAMDERRAIKSLVRIGST